MAQSKDLSVKTVATVAGVTSQASGIVMNADINILTMTQAADAIVLPANLPAGTLTYIVNTSANAGVLFPAVGGAGNGGSVNASVVVTASKTIIVLSTGSNNFRTMSAATV